VAVDLAFPAAFPGIVGELFLEAEAFAEPRRVLGRGDELGAGQVEVALARAFLGQAHPARSRVELAAGAETPALAFRAAPAQPLPQRLAGQAARSG